MDTRETPAANAAEAAAPCREARHIYALAMQRTFLTEEMVLAHTCLCCLLLPKIKEVTCHPPGFILNGSVHLNKPSNKKQGKD